jgi:hypothetical protein
MIKGKKLTFVTLQLLIVKKKILIPPHAYLSYAADTFMA